MIETSPRVLSAHQLAEQRTREIMHAQAYARDIVVDSPPGAGKTGVVERLAVQGAWVNGQRVMIATQTNAQAFDLARRLAENWRPNVCLFSRKGLALPRSLTKLPNLFPVTSIDDFPEGPCVVVANSRKWSYARLEDNAFDLLIVEEAYQLRDAEFVQIAGFAARRVLVGDPGQIDPVTSCDVSRWSAMPDGPHTSAPAALLLRRPDATLRMKLPVSRRLPADTVRVVQPAFYPDLPFQATSEPGDRQLLPGPAPDAAEPMLDEMIDRAAAGETLVLGELPDKVTGEFDSELAERIVATIGRLLTRATRIRDHEWKPETEREMALTPGEIGVTCGHRSQVNAIQERLGALQAVLGDPATGAPDLSQVLVETSDRFQGLERQVMLVHHPLAGRLSATDFHLDAGRLCVMLSRHRVACFIFGRAGMLERLESQQAPAQRVLGPIPDSLWSGNARHRALLDLMDRENRIVRP
jgi:hypothetical protein